MKRFICIALALIACLVLFASCGKDTDVPEGYQLVSDEEDTYRFYAPTTWTVNKTGGTDCVYYSSTDMSMVLVNFFNPTTENTELESFWEYTEAQYKEQYEDYRLIEEKIAVTLGTRNAYSYTFTAKISNTEYKIMQVITGYGSYYYVMTYMSSPANFDAHIDEVRGMMSVFSFR